MDWTTIATAKLVVVVIKLVLVTSSCRMDQHSTTTTLHYFKQQVVWELIKAQLSYYWTYHRACWITAQLIKPQAIFIAFTAIEVEFSAVIFAWFSSSWFTFVAFTFAFVTLVIKTSARHQTAFTTSFATTFITSTFTSVEHLATTTAFRTIIAIKAFKAWKKSLAITNQMD